MAVYSLGGLTSILTASAATAELRSASTDRVALLNWTWGLLATPAAAFTLAIGRPAAIGITPTTPVTLIAEDPAEPAATSQLVTAGWGTAPTVPAQFFRRYRIFRAIRVHWEFPKGLVIGTSNSVVLWNAVSTATATQIFVVVDE